MPSLASWYLGNLSWVPPTILNDLYKHGCDLFIAQVQSLSGLHEDLSLLATDTSTARVMASQAELQPSGIEPEYALGELYRMCVASFREYLQTIGSREPIDNSCTIEPLDEYGRFVNWGEQTRAYLSKYSRGSLDEHVQDHPTVKQVIESTLQQLLKSFESGKYPKLFW